MQSVQPFNNQLDQAYWLVESNLSSQYPFTNYTYDNNGESLLALVDQTDHYQFFSGYSTINTIIDHVEPQYGYYSSNYQIGDVTSQQTTAQLPFIGEQQYGSFQFGSEQAWAQGDSSVFLSPLSSYPSSAEQSPQQPVQDELDLILNDIEIDEILNSDEDDGSSLFDMLQKAGCTDLLDMVDDEIELPVEIAPSESSSSSANSTPQRKYSSDSSDCLSVASFETASSLGSPKPKRTRRSKHSKEERAARKKDQNKRAALRYRSKKKDQQENGESILKGLEDHKAQLTKQFNTLETEFRVIVSLAKQAFQDPVRSKQLQDLLTRLSQYGIQ